MYGSARRIRQSSAVVVAALAVTLAACHKDSPAAPVLAAKIVPTTGSSAQTGTVGQPLAAPVTVQVLNTSGSPMTGVTVIWTVWAGSGSLDSDTTVTDASGDATVHWTLGTLSGVDSVWAQVGGSVELEVYATAQPGAVAALQKVSGDQQAVPDGSVSAPIVVQAVDQYGNAVPGAAITWVDENGGVLSAARTTTNAQGDSSITLTADPTTETYTIVAEDGSAEVTYVLTSP